jgi:hypothetical protein
MIKQSFVFHDTEVNEIYNHIRTDNDLPVQDNTSYKDLVLGMKKSLLLPEAFNHLFTNTKMKFVIENNILTDGDITTRSIPALLIPSDDDVTAIIIPPLCAQLPNLSYPLTITKMNGGSIEIKANDCFSQCVILYGGDTCSYFGKHGQFIYFPLISEDVDIEQLKEHEHHPQVVNDGYQQNYDSLDREYMTSGMAEIADLIPPAPLFQQTIGRNMRDNGRYSESYTRARRINYDGATRRRIEPIPFPGPNRRGAVRRNAMVFNSDDLGIINESNQDPVNDDDDMIDID